MGIYQLLLLWHALTNNFFHLQSFLLKDVCYCCKHPLTNSIFVLSLLLMGV